jgi:hypothetical protein
MQIGDIDGLSDFTRYWIEDAIRVFGLMPLAAYVDEYGDERTQVLVATRSGVLEFHSEGAGSESRIGRFHAWREVQAEVVVESVLNQFSQSWMHTMHVTVDHFGIDATKPVDDRVGLADFARVCIAHQQPA